MWYVALAIFVWAMVLGMLIVFMMGSDRRK